MGLQVDVVDLESDDGVPGGGSELAAILGPEDDLLVVEEVDDRLHRRQRAGGERDPTDRAGGEVSAIKLFPQLPIKNVPWVMTYE